MAGSGTSLWPSLVAGNRARASEVEFKFDWLEANVLPMLSGSTTDLVYDLGTSTARWNFGNIDKVMCQSINPTSTAKCVVIGTTTAVTAAANNSDVALEIAGIRSFLFPRLTTTQRTNLAGINGMVVYDSTLNLFQKYENGAWAKLGGAVIGFVAPIFASVTSASTATVAAISAPGRLLRITNQYATGGTKASITLNIDGTLFGDIANPSSVTIAYMIMGGSTTANTATTFAFTTTFDLLPEMGVFFKNTLNVYHKSNAGIAAQTGVYYERT